MKWRENVKEGKVKEVQTMTDDMGNTLSSWVHPIMLPLFMPNGNSGSPNANIDHTTVTTRIGSLEPSMLMDDC